MRPSLENKGVSFDLGTLKFSQEFVHCQLCLCRSHKTRACRRNVAFPSFALPIVYKTPVANLVVHAIANPALCFSTPTRCCGLNSQRLLFDQWDEQSIASLSPQLLNLSTNSKLVSVDDASERRKAFEARIANLLQNDLDDSLQSLHRFRDKLSGSLVGLEMNRVDFHKAAEHRSESMDRANILWRWHEIW